MSQQQAHTPDTVISATVQALDKLKHCTYKEFEGMFAGVPVHTIQHLYYNKFKGDCDCNPFEFYRILDFQNREAFNNYVVSLIKQ